MFDVFRVLATKEDDTRIGFLQTAPRFGAVEKNRRQIEQLLDGQAADLWVLPELALTGYDFLDVAELRRYAEEIPGGESTAWLHSLAAKHHAAFVMGLPELAGNRRFNSVILVGPKGFIGRYRKLHLFDREKELFEPGDEWLQPIEVDGVKIGIMICFDWIFPEVARTLALRGAQVLCHPSNLMLPYCQKAMFARAVENGVFAVTSNRVGREDRAGRELVFTGGSQILSPKGDLLAQAGEETIEVKVAEIEPEAALQKNVTPTNHLFGDRRPAFYGLG
ncbi:MAG: nitrilase-related carbon-nitrogen hydrolase [bacterium]